MWHINISYYNMLYYILLIYYLYITIYYLCITLLIHISQFWNYHNRQKYIFVESTSAFVICQHRRQRKKIHSQWYMTFLLPRYRLLQFRDIDILLLRSDPFFFRGEGGLNLVGLVAWECVLYQTLGSYFETIKPGIYMRSRSLTAGSAG